MTRLEMENRRLNAAVELAAGARCADVAIKFGVTRVSASRWAYALTHGKSLKAGPTPGRPSRLTASQRADLLKLYRKQKAAGLKWTHRTVKALIFERYGIHYHHDYCCRIFQRLRQEISATTNVVSPYYPKKKKSP